MAEIKHQLIFFKVRTVSPGGLKVGGFPTLVLASDEPLLRGSVLVSEAILRLSEGARVQAGHVPNQEPSPSL